MNNIPLLSPQLPLPRQLAILCMFEQYMLEAIDVQQFEPRLREHTRARTLVRRILAVVKKQSDNLAQAIAALPDGPADLAAAASALAGFFASFFRKTRAREVPDILRNDYMLLNLAATGHATLHKSGKVLREEKAVGLAQTHRRELRALVRAILRLTPELAGSAAVPSAMGREASPILPLNLPIQRREEAFGEPPRKWLSA